ncbi:MAG: universal stress protein, partial [Fibrella sp.]|nr:universal stress protein [Armatimonadota bacterium]
AIASRRAEDTDESEAWVAQENSRLRARAEETLAATVALFAERGIITTPRIIEGSPASAVIAEEACRGRYDLLVMTSRGLGAGRSERYYLGSVTENVLKKVDTPVLVIPIHPDGRLNLTQGDVE